MDKVIFLFFMLVLGASCTRKPDYSSEIKTIDSLQNEMQKNLDECKKMDTMWIHPVTDKASNIMIDIKDYYKPDSVIQEDVKIISYYKGFRKVGKRFREGKKKLIEEMEISLKQLSDLKKDAENGLLKKEELDKYLVEEKLVTTDLIYQFKDMKYSTAEILRNFDSLTPMIESIVEVYRKENELTPAQIEKRKRGTTIHN